MTRLRAMFIGVCFAAVADAQYTLTTTQHSQTVLVRNTHGYDYVPTVMFDGKYRMWWCGSRPNYPGDHIFYAEADSLNGPWTSRSSSTPNTFQVVLAPSRIAGRFDADHVCDPTVVRSGSEYYMFYGGTHAGAPWQAMTAIGVARSSDGIHWTRMNNGQPILASHQLRFPFAASRPYGTGQPSVNAMKDWFYIVYTDHLGLASNPGNGAGQYVLRSRDPLFMTGVQAMTANGWAIIPDGSPASPESWDRYAARTQYSLVEAFSVDWTYSDMLSAFVVARHNEWGQTDISIWSNLDAGHQNLSATRLTVPGIWVDGPGLVRRPDGHAMPSATCGEVPIDLVRSSGSDVWASTLSASRSTLMAWGHACNSATWGSVFNSWKVVSPGLPLMVVVNGTRLQMALPGPADQLSRNTFTVSSELYHQIPYGASLFAANPAWGTPGQPAAFYLDDRRLWPVSCSDILRANGSGLRQVTSTQYGQTPKGPALFCIR